jgi:hypothetical protein
MRISEARRLAELDATGKGFAVADIYWALGGSGIGALGNVLTLVTNCQLRRLITLSGRGFQRQQGATERARLGDSQPVSGSQGWRRVARRCHRRPAMLTHSPRNTVVLQ